MGPALDDEFIILPLGGMWVVTCAEVIVARCVTTSEAMKAAVRTAARYASYGRAVQVVLDMPEGRTVVWNSRRDGFAEG